MIAKRSVAPVVGCTTDDGVASPGTLMDATRLAAICAKIEEYAAGGSPMSSRRVAAICAMIDDRAAAAKTHRNKRRRKLCVDSTRSYKQIGEIGIGSSGAVVEARHRKTGQTVTIKTFRRRDGKSVVSELLREACFLAACGGHPHLVGLHAVARDPRTKKYSLVMEYAGPSLRRALRERLRAHGAPFPEAEVRRIMRQLLTGAEAMHAHRIVHRDIKPGNVLVSEDGGGAVKICDYGLAMCTAGAGPPYARAGTAWYIAPEVLTRRTDYDERVDLWSLGCVMAELLSGEVLFKVGGGTRQLDRMFDVLGTPGEQTLQTFAEPFTVGKVLRRFARLTRWPSNPGRLREVFPSETLSQDGLDVLKGLLMFNRKERLTAAAALRLPWFTAADDAPASAIGATAASFVRVLASGLAFLRMSLELIRLPRHCSGHKAS
ncbi:hypothetical protein C2845_PM03G36290 [Panicum miliaceum]|uniref:[RNA-polymerase]-subunit kinase n=1 Tax=Panicum miliaceum TaxID=4540 RepID=A0A3L6TB81_PANMI|nr:hypothetical protein C2845_PM03G36290 [Panicum miliaceum]